VSKWEQQLAAAAPMEQFKLFRELGVVGKLHNFINTVCASHKMRERFGLIQKQANNDETIYSFNTLNLCQDGGVRWHSVYLMMLRCLALQEPIKLFIRKLRANESLADDSIDYSPLTDGITDDEWDEAKELVAKYPILFKISTNYLSIPSTSCDCERAFSKARRTISDDRNSLGGLTIEAIQLLKNWIQRGVVKSQLKGLAKHVQNIDKKRAGSAGNSLLGGSNSQPEASYAP
jgi:hypothetical protein